MLVLFLFTFLPLLVLGRLPRDRYDLVNKQRRELLQKSQAMETQLQKRASNSSSYRYYTNTTSKYLVKSLPVSSYSVLISKKVANLPAEQEVPYNLTEMYSGNIAIDTADPSRNLFFVFQPTINDPVDEIVIWLNGGPGCSSLEGFFQENGLYSWQPGTLYPTLNPYAWVNESNVLWVEQPVGTGFSQGEIRATNETSIAQDFVKFFKNFQTIFGIKNYKYAREIRAIEDKELLKTRIFVTGESYAGRYVPYISYEMLLQNSTQYFNLSGALVYDPCIGNYIYTANEVTAYPFAERNNNILSLNSSTLAMAEKMHQTCGYQGYIDHYLQFPPPGLQPEVIFNFTSNATCDVWSAVLEASLTSNVCFDPYEITTPCPILFDPLGFPGQFGVNVTQIYFDRDDVKAAMHAPTNVSWGECSSERVIIYNGTTPEAGSGDSSPDPAQFVLPKVIEATNRVLVSNGDYDYIIITNGTLLAIQNMTWGGHLGFQSKPNSTTYVAQPDLQYTDLFDNQGFEGVDDIQGTVGIHHYERGLMWAETFASGHMQPQFQPRVGLVHLQWLLGRIDSLPTPPSS